MFNGYYKKILGIYMKFTEKLVEKAPFTRGFV
jgi:hypothetical protein